MSGMKYNDFILLALCQNGANDVADENTWHLNQNRFIMLTCSHTIILKALLITLFMVFKPGAHRPLASVLLVS